MNLSSIFFSGDLVLTLVFISLLSMSLLSWYVIFYKGLKLKNEYHAYKIFCKNSLTKINWVEDFSKISKQTDFKISQNLLSKNSINFLINEINKIYPTLEKYNPDQKKEILTMHLIQALDEIRFKLDHGLTILASIGSCAPFVGLFCAIPAVLAYNSFVRLNRLLVQNLRHLAEQLTVYLPIKN